MSSTIFADPSASLIELLYPDFAGEHASTRRLLACVPEGHAEWRPHPRSRPLAELATHVADIPNRGVDILTHPELDSATRQRRATVTTTAELLAIHDDAVARFTEALAQADLSVLSVDWTLQRGPQVLLRGPRRTLLRILMMSHLVHHRAQLGVYLRMLEVPIPGMYGPSADDLAARGVS